MTSSLKTVVITIDSAPHNGQQHLAGCIIAALKEVGVTGDVEVVGKAITIMTHGLTEESIAAMKPKVTDFIVELSTSAKLEF